VTHTYTATGSYSATLTVTNDRGGSASQTVLITVSPERDVINAPGSLTASAASGRVTLRWTDASTNETGFHVERTPFKQNAWTRVGTVGANVTTFSETASRGTYDYRVQAFNGTTGRTSGYSNVARVRVR
jgi:PKD repeat protein